jgi:FKBP-type peptidyl-prolyl cis-trans isomerase
MKYLVLIMLISALFIIGCSNEPDVVTTESGLSYMDDSLGTGTEAKMGDLVSVHFTGWIVSDSTNLYEDWSADSTRMNHSIGTSEGRPPLKFVLGEGNFIKGSEEGIAGMKPGGKRTLIIPSENAYGEQGIGPIPPNSSLKVVITLLETKEIETVEMWEADTTKFNTTKSGLKYQILEEGSGEKVDSGDAVTVHYSGFLSDGYKFDSSVERDEPFKFVVGQRMVIPGWDEGIALLKEGDKAKFIIPPGLGYGEMPVGKIPANSTLIFDVELIDVENQ